MSFRLIIEDPDPKMSLDEKFVSLKYTTSVEPKLCEKGRKLKKTRYLFFLENMQDINFMNRKYMICCQYLENVIKLKFTYLYLLKYGTQLDWKKREKYKGVALGSELD